MTADEREIRLRLPNVGVEIVGIRDIEKRGDIIMKYSPVEDEKSGRRCPRCHDILSFIMAESQCVRYNRVFEGGDIEEYDYSCDEVVYYCPNCGYEFSYSEVRRMGVDV